MKSITLQFKSIGALAEFTKSVTTGFLVNTAKLTVSGKFSPDEINWAFESLQAEDVANAPKETNDTKVDWL